LPARVVRNHLLRTVNFQGDVPRRSAEQPGMRIGVIADFVTLFGDAPREIGEALDVLAAEKKGGPDSGLL
jgi:hypothetical protein